MREKTSFSGDVYSSQASTKYNNVAMRKQWIESDVLMAMLVGVTLVRIMLVRVTLVGFTLVRVTLVGRLRHVGLEENAFEYPGVVPVI